MKKIRRLFALLMVVTTLTVSFPAVFAADDDVFFPRSIIKPIEKY